MRRNLSNTLIAIGTAAVVFLAYSFVPDVEKPLLDAEFSQMALHQYSYYNEFGSVPTGIDHIPDGLRQLVGDGASGITWNAPEQTLSYEYPEPVAMRRSTLSQLSFGLIKTKANILGRSITPDSIFQNTPIYKAVGLLGLTNTEPSNKKQNKTHIATPRKQSD